MTKTESQVPIIKDGALFIADSHYMDSDYRFFNFVRKLILSPPKQVFLMGDIFHLLIGHLPSSQKQNFPLISLINELSDKTEIFYFEGNHDFGIDSFLLPKVKLYPRSLQPALFIWKEKRFLLAHGDIFLTRSYDFYIRTLNNPITLSFLKILDRLSFGIIYGAIAKKICQKSIKPLQINEKVFKKFSLERFQKYSKFAKKNNLGSIDGIIEGHFHIGKNLKHYISLPSFYCQKSAFIIQSNEIANIME
ncbi:hypothetical protein BKH41_07095 [Helicobacter sp. 12S02232-10]|nr:hypothetical protein BKH41_07095 [Helicobacter sp. 12S02232-10]